MNSKHMANIFIMAAGGFLLFAVICLVRGLNAPNPEMTFTWYMRGLVAVAGSMSSSIISTMLRFQRDRSDQGSTRAVSQ